MERDFKTAAAIQQIRYAAMECVLLSDGPTAASIVMCAGIVAAIVGPEIALAGKNLSSVDCQGSFWLGAGYLIGAGILLLAYTPAHQHAPAPGPRPTRKANNSKPRR